MLLRLKFNLYLHLATLTSRIGATRLAIGFATGAVALFPRRWKAQYVLGIALLDTGEAKRSAVALASALRRRVPHSKVEAHIVKALSNRCSPLDLIKAASSLDAPEALHILCGALFRCDALSTQDLAAIEHLTTIRRAKVMSIRAWSHKNDGQVSTAGLVEEIVQIKPPLLGPEGFMPAPPSHEVVYSEEPYVADLINVRIFSKSDTILADDGTALSDLATHPTFGRQVDLREDALIVSRKNDDMLVDIRGTAFVEHTGGIFLVGAASAEFGHWVQELLMKLQFLEQHPDFPNLPIIVDEAMPQAHLDYLRRVVRNEIFLLPNNSSLTCKRLLVAPTPTFHPINMLGKDIPRTKVCALSPTGLRYLQDRVTRGLEKAGEKNRKLYLSRRNMRWRRIANDSDLSSMLAKRGFEIIYIERHSFAEQIQMLSEASCIIAPEGSALLNIIFCDPSVKLIILAQRDFWYGYCGPLSSLGYTRQLWVLGDTMSKEKHDDYTIPLDRVERALSIIEAPENRGGSFPL